MLSVVVPAFEAARFLDDSLRRLRGFLADTGHDWELVLVDDGSGDETAAIAARHHNEEPRVKLVRLAENSGKGAAVRAGVEVASGQRILICDADLAVPLLHTGPLFALLDAGNDLAVGSRTLAGAELVGRRPFHRRVARWVFNTTVRLLRLSDLSDTQCGFKLLTAAAAQSIMPRLKTSRFAFDVEVLFLARRLGYAVAEAPVSVREDLPSTVRPIVDGSRMFWDLATMRVWAWMGRYDRPPSPGEG